MPRTGLSRDQIRDQAIAVAMDIIRSNGLKNLKLIDVAKALNLSHAALYSHFENKAALCEATMAHWLKRTEDATSEILSSNGPAEQRLLDWFHTLYMQKRQSVNNDPRLFHALEIAMLGKSPAAMSHVETLLRQITDLLSQMDEPSLPDKAALLLFEATMPFHNPILIEIVPGDDGAYRLRQIVGALLTGWKHASIPGKA